MRRLERLRTKLAEQGLEALLVSQPENRRYLSGFTGSAGYLLILPKSALLLTDFRYTEQAKHQVTPGFEVIQIGVDISQWLGGVIAEYGVTKLGIEAHHISLATYQRLTQVLKGIELVPTYGVVEKLRMIKEKEEIQLIERAARLSDEAMEYISHNLHPGMEEREAAWLVERYLRERGSQPLPFDIIIAGGLNSALPHARPSGRPLDAKTPIVVDLGAKIEGYSSDLTRTFFLGDKNKVAVFHKVYEVVLTAQQKAIESIKPGMTAKEADSIARSIIEQAGYGEAFGHGLGHGVGLATHEAPTLSSFSEEILQEGMVFTLEPGIYLPDWGGVRVEDMVVLEKKGVRLLTQAKKLFLEK